MESLFNEQRKVINTVQYNIQSFDVDKFMVNVNENLLPGLADGMKALADLAKEDDVKEAIGKTVELTASIVKNVTPHYFTLYNSIFDAVDTFNNSITSELDNESYAKQADDITNQLSSVKYKHPLKSARLLLAKAKLTKFTNELGITIPKTKDTTEA